MTLLPRKVFFGVATGFFVLGFFFLFDVFLASFFPYNRPARPRNAETFVVSSPTRVLQLIPNADFNYNNVSYQTNSRGFRDREFPVNKTPGVKRVAVLGDSFIEGYGEKQEHSLPATLERELRAQLGNSVEVMNCGVQGGSPAVYQFWIQELAGYQLDAAVICIFDNDMDDDACALLKKAWYRARAWYRTPAGLRRSNILSYLIGEAANVKFKLQRKIISNALFNEDNFVREKRRHDGRTNAIGSNAYGYLSEPDNWKPHWERTEANLNRLADAARSLGIPLLIVFIPSDVTVPILPIKVKPDKLWVSGFKEDVFSYWVGHWALNRGLPSVNLFENIVAWYGNPKNERLYDPSHGHFNPLGLRRAAGWIKPELLKVLNENS